MTQKDFGPPNGKSPAMGEGNVLREAKDVASHLMSEAKGEVTQRASSQKTRAAESLHGVADALRGTKEQLDEKAPGFGLYADRAADAVENLSEYIRNQTVGDVIDKVEHFARREPALFIGGAVAIGLFAGRFLRSGQRGGRMGYEGGGERRGFRGYERDYEDESYGRDYGREDERDIGRDFSGGYGAGYGGIDRDQERRPVGSDDPSSSKPDAKPEQKLASRDQGWKAADTAEDLTPGLDVSPGNEEQATSRGPVGDFGGKKSGTGSEGSGA